MKRITYKIEWRAREGADWRTGHPGIIVRHEWTQHHVPDINNWDHAMVKCDIEDFRITATWEEESEE